MASCYPAYLDPTSGSEFQMKARERPIEERLLEKIAFCPTTGCWIWLGDLNKNGYGRISIHNKLEYAHRACYIAFKGRIPFLKQLDHLCRLSACVNPDHLEAVSSATNLHRGNAPSMVIWRSGKCGTCGTERVPRGRSGRLYCKKCNREQQAKIRSRLKLTSK